MADEVVESIVIDAAALDVYSLVSDVARIGSYSPEAIGAARAGRSLVAGDRFVGFNRRGPVIWWTYCTVLRAEPGVAFEFDVDFGPVPVSRWSYDFEALDGGATKLTETWIDRRGGRTGLPVRLLGQAVIPGDRAEHNRGTMQVTLRRLKEAAEG